jgi:hypothetical protein
VLLFSVPVAVDPVMLPRPIELDLIALGVPPKAGEAPVVPLPAPTPACAKADAVKAIVPQATAARKVFFSIAMTTLLFACYSRDAPLALCWHPLS